LTQTLRLHDDNELDEKFQSQQLKSSQKSFIDLNRNEYKKGIF